MVGCAANDTAEDRISETTDKIGLGRSNLNYSCSTSASTVCFAVFLSFNTDCLQLFIKPVTYYDFGVSKLIQYIKKTYFCQLQVLTSTTDYFKQISCFAVTSF